MKFQLYKMKTNLKKKLIKFWYWLMKPIAYFFTVEKEDARYRKRASKITKQQAINWIAEDIVRYVIKHNTEIDILICDFANDDYFWNGCTLSGTCPYYIRRDKTKMAFHKFNKDIEFQEKVISIIKTIKSVEVEEVVEKFTWQRQRIDNYVKTVTIKS